MGKNLSSWLKSFISGKRNFICLSLTMPSKAYLCSSNSNIWPDMRWCCHCFATVFSAYFAVCFGFIPTPTKCYHISHGGIFLVLIVMTQCKDDKKLGIFPNNGLFILLNMCLFKNMLILFYYPIFTLWNKVYIFLRHGTWQHVVNKLSQHKKRLLAKLECLKASSWTSIRSWDFINGSLKLCFA